MKNILNLFTNVLFLAFVFLFPVLLKAQSDPGTGKWSAGVHFSPCYSYRTLHEETTLPGIKEYRDSVEVAAFGYEVGSILSFHHTDHFSLESGLSFSARHYHTPYQDIVFEEDEAVEQFSKDNYFYDLSVPLTGRYTFFPGKVRWVIQAGVSLDIFLLGHTVSRLKYTDGHITKSSGRMTADFSRFGMSALVGAGIEFPISSQISIRVLPQYHHSLFPLLDAPVKEYQWSFGLDTGISYRFQPH